MMRDALREGGLLLVIALLFVSAFARTAGYAFVWDDVAEIERNELLRGPLLAGLAASQHQHMGIEYGEGLRPVHDSYRPLRYLSYRIDFALSGGTASAMHVHNVVLGLLVLLAAYWMLREWGLPASLRLAGVALLALHPVAVESVAYVSARSDLLAGGFMLCACAASLRFLRGAGARWAGVAALCYCASLASKEALLAVPFGLCVVAFARGALRRFAVLASAFALVLGLWWTLRSAFAAAAGEGRALEALAALGPVLAQYARVLLVPADCTIVRPAAAGHFGVTAGVLLAYALLAVRSLRHPRGAAPAVLAALSWFALVLGPSIVATRVTSVASDRYAYLALLALPLLAFALKPALAQLGRPTRRLLAAITALWVLCLVYITDRQIASWANPPTLYAHAVELEPSSAAAWYGLGHALIAARGCEVAGPLFARALELDPGHARALNNLGVCQLRRGALDDAERAFRGVLQLARGVHPRAWFNLAQIHLQRRRTAEACDELRTALTIDPGYERARMAFTHYCVRGNVSR